MEVREFFNDIRDLTKKRLDPDKFDKYGNRQTGNEDFTGKVYCLDMQGKLFPSIGSKDTVCVSHSDGEYCL